MHHVLTIRLYSLQHVDMENTEPLCFVSNIIIFQAYRGRKELCMTELIGLAFSAVAGICFVSGIAVLVGGKEI